jgi:anti-sigma factor RsiW
LSTTDQMTCQELVELVTEYLEGTLPLTDRARFEAHLAECAYCVAYVEQMRVTIDLLGALDEEQLSSEARDELMSAFRDWKRGGATGPGG